MVYSYIKTEITVGIHVPVEVRHADKVGGFGSLIDRDAAETLQNTNFVGMPNLNRNMNPNSYFSFDIRINHLNS